MCVSWQPVLHLDLGTERCALLQRSGGKKCIYLNLFSSVSRECHSSLSTIMAENRYVLRKLLSSGRCSVQRQFLGFDFYSGFVLGLFFVCVWG